MKLAFVFLAACVAIISCYQFHPGLMMAGPRWIPPPPVPFPRHGIFNYPPQQLNAFPKIIQYVPNGAVPLDQSGPMPKSISTEEVVNEDEEDPVEQRNIVDDDDVAEERNIEDDEETTGEEEEEGIERMDEHQEDESEEEEGAVEDTAFADAMPRVKAYFLPSPAPDTEARIKKLGFKVFSLNNKSQQESKKADKSPPSKQESNNKSNKKPQQQKSQPPSKASQKQQAITSPQKKQHPIKKEQQQQKHSKHNKSQQKTTTAKPIKANSNTKKAEKQAAKWLQKQQQNLKNKSPVLDEDKAKFFLQNNKVVGNTYTLTYNIAHHSALMKTVTFTISSTCTALTFVTCIPSTGLVAPIVACNVGRRRRREIQMLEAADGVNPTEIQPVVPTAQPEVSLAEDTRIAKSDGAITSSKEETAMEPIEGDSEEDELERQKRFLAQYGYNWWQSFATGVTTTTWLVTSTTITQTINPPVGTPFPCLPASISVCV